MKRLQNIDVKGKHVVVRVDFDDPIRPNGTLESDFRIRASLPTIEYLQSHGAKQIVLVSKLGRPVVRPREQIETIIAGNPRLSIKPVALYLRELMGKASERLTLRHMEDFPLPAYVIDRGLYLLENIRFDWRESANNPDFAKQLAGLGDLYVYEAFAMSGSPPEASTVGVIPFTEFVAGLQVQREIESLDKLQTELTSPFVMILGGAKTETKLPVIEHLLDKVDSILLGGVMANTFAKSQGIDIKRSVVDDKLLSIANQLYKRDPNKFVLPSDYIWQHDKIMDIGEQARVEFALKIQSAKTIFWNGTLGVTSMSARDFAYGSLEIAKAIAANRSATSIICGGDTVGLLQAQSIELGQYTFISTGGGATLKFLAGEQLPVLQALK